MVSKEIVCKITNITEFPQPEPALQDFFSQDYSDFLENSKQKQQKAPTKAGKSAVTSNLAKKVYSGGFEGFGCMIHRKIKST